MFHEQLGRHVTENNEQKRKCKEVWQEAKANNSLSLVIKQRNDEDWNIGSL